MWDKSNCSVIGTLFKITFLEKWDERGERSFLWPLTSYPDRHVVNNNSYMRVPKYVKTWRHLQHRQYITYCAIIGQGRAMATGNMYITFRSRSDFWDMRTVRHRDIYNIHTEYRHANHNTLHPSRKGGQTEEWQKSLHILITTSWRK